MRRRDLKGGPPAAPKAGPPPSWQLHRIVLGPPEIRSGRVLLSPANTHHVRKVLRLRHGDWLRGLAPEGHDLLLATGDLQAGRLDCEVRGRLEPLPEPALSVAVCQALTRAERFEYTLQKATELGATEFYPLLAARSVVRPDAPQAAARLTRWRRIVEEAALQCGRPVIPELHGVVGMDELAVGFAASPRDLMLVPYEAETRSLREVLARWREAVEQGAGVRGAGGSAGGPRTAAVVIGPEGGLEPSEVETLRSVGFIPVSLGPRILRTETAGPAAVAILLYEFGDLGGRGAGR